MTARTFRPRRRRLSPTRQRRFEALAPTWTLAVDGAPIDWSSVFGNSAPIVFDIGIGRGESCVEMATADPDRNIVGIDVHTPGIAAAVLAIDDRGLSNLRLIEGDVFDVLHRVPPRSVAGLRVFFPDPWPKPRHRPRRLVTDERLGRLLRVVDTGGFLHLATDCADYAEQMISVADGQPLLVGGRIERPASRPVTRYERRGREAGREIVDLWYRVER